MLSIDHIPLLLVCVAFALHVLGERRRISALVDQQLAGGIMLGLGSLASTVYVFVALYRWLGEDPATRAACRASAEAS